MKLGFNKIGRSATLLIVFGICVLFAGIVLYWRWATWSDARQTFDQAAAEKSRLDRLDPFPNDANYRKLQGYLDRYNTALDKFKDELKKEVVPAPPLAPNEFQSRLRLATVATLNRAQTNNVKLPDKFQLGFDEFAHVVARHSCGATPWAGAFPNPDAAKHSAGRKGRQRHFFSSRAFVRRTRSFVDSDAISSRRTNGYSNQNSHTATGVIKAQHCRSNL